MTDIAGQPPQDVKWVIAVAGREEQIVVEAATIENQRGTGTHHGGAGDVVLTLLLDAAGQIVFQAPTLSIAYLRRFGPPGHVIESPAFIAKGSDGR